MRVCTRALIVGIAGAVAVGLLVWVLVFHQPALRVAEILAQYDEAEEYTRAAIRYPFSQAVFPPEITAPTFRWEDSGSGADAWLVRIEFPDGAEPLAFESPAPQWTPAQEDWKTIKNRSLGSEAKVTILGVRRADQLAILSAAQTVIHTSPDEVGAPIFYREVNLPFLEAVRDPSRIRWRFGDVSSAEPPPIVLEKLPVCGNCHSFSKDASVMGMDVDYANDKGSYVILPVAPNMVLQRERIFTWSDYRPEDRQPTFGLLSAISPDGKYAVSTVKDQSVFVAVDDLEYSQLFFPIKGILAVYNRQTGQIHSLPGADDPQYVQSNATWSPDGEYIVFARSKAHTIPRAGSTPSVLLTQEECREFLTEGKTFLFDLYRIPFNEGKGGQAEPIEGASQNGTSNYFAKFSPDGKWIVFCRAKSFMLLQPDSELWIMPAEGGQPRRLACNLPGMNSWHSWSPNGKWLVFSSKTFTPYTQLFLAHIDQHGRSSPPVLLSQFTAPDRAANIPEFVDLRPDAIQTITERFLDDYNYARIALEYILADDLDRAEEACQKALELNPNSPEALCNLGVVMARRGQLDAAIACYARAAESDPDNIDIRMNLGNALSRQNRLEESLTHYQEALRLDPDLFAARLSLGQNLIRLGRFDDAVEHLSKAASLRPTDASAESYLAAACQRRGDLDQAVTHYTSVLERQPDFVPALAGLAIIRASAPQPELRDPEEGLRLARTACELTGFEDAESLAVLAAVYAEAGRYGEAAQTARQGLDAARKTGDDQFIQAIQRSVEHYENLDNR